MGNRYYWLRGSLCLMVFLLVDLLIRNPYLFTSLHTGAKNTNVLGSKSMFDRADEILNQGLVDMVAIINELQAAGNSAYAIRSIFKRFLGAKKLAFRGTMVGVSHESSQLAVAYAKKIKKYMRTRGFRRIGIENSRECYQSAGHESKWFWAAFLQELNRCEEGEELFEIVFLDHEPILSWHAYVMPSTVGLYNLLVEVAKMIPHAVEHSASMLDLYKPTKAQLLQFLRQNVIQMMSQMGTCSLVQPGTLPRIPVFLAYGNALNNEKVEKAVQELYDFVMTLESYSSALTVLRSILMLATAASKDLPISVVGAGHVYQMVAYCPDLDLRVLDCMDTDLGRLARGYFKDDLPNLTLIHDKLLFESPIQEPYGTFVDESQQLLAMLEVSESA